MCDNNRNKCDSVQWTYLLRQLLVNSGAWSSFFILGLNMGAPTVVLPQLRNETNASYATNLTEGFIAEETAWNTYNLAIIFNYGGLPWGFSLPIIAAIFGRKISHTLVCISTLIGFIVFYCSNGVWQIMISEFFQGPLMASYITILIVVITEYTSKEYRGLFLTIKSASFFWGILASNSIGTFLPWKYIPMLGIICAIYNVITVFFWPESPLWLAKKGRFEQCAKSHRWLKGYGTNSEQELEKLIHNKKIVEEKLPFKRQLINTMKSVAEKQFYKPVLLSILLMSLYLFSGKMIYTIYAVDILKKITNNTPVAYTGMLILDTVTVFTMYVGCALAKRFKRRPLLLIPAAFSILFLLLLSLYLFLVKLSVVPEEKYVSISLLVGFSLTNGCGPLILSTSIAGELLPIESRSLALIAIVVFMKIMNSTFLKISPYFFTNYGMHGTFCIFGVSSLISLVLLYFYLPETKDKTLMEIADCISDTAPAAETIVEEGNELLPAKRTSMTIVPNNGNS